MFACHPRRQLHVSWWSSDEGMGMPSWRRSSPSSTADAAERADDLVNVLDRERHLAVHSGLVLCREQEFDCVVWREICAYGRSVRAVASALGLAPLGTARDRSRISRDFPPPSQPTR
jgi:hypothetical protein